MLTGTIEATRGRQRPDRHSAGLRGTSCRWPEGMPRGGQACASVHVSAWVRACMCTCEHVCEHVSTRVRACACARAALCLSLLSQPHEVSFLRAGHGLWHGGVLV